MRESNRHRDPARSAAPTHARAHALCASTGVCHSSCETMRKLVIVNAPLACNHETCNIHTSEAAANPAKSGILSAGPTRSRAHMPARRTRARICMRMRAVSRAAGPSWCARKARGISLPDRRQCVDAAVPSRECGVHVSGHTRAYMHHMLRRRLSLCSARHPIDAAAIGPCRRGPV